MSSWRCVGMLSLLVAGISPGQEDPRNSQAAQLIRGHRLAEGVALYQAVVSNSVEREDLSGAYWAQWQLARVRDASIPVDVQLDRFSLAYDYLGRCPRNDYRWALYHRLNAIQLLCEKETLLDQQGRMGAARLETGRAEALVREQWGGMPSAEGVRQDSETARGILISYLLDEAKHHGLAGRLPQAEASHRAAVQVCRQLPASGMQKASLVRALNNLADLLGDLGRTVEQDELSEEANEIRAGTADDLYPEINRLRRSAEREGPSPELVAALTGKAERLRAAGREADALKTQRKCATLLFALGQTNEAWAAFAQVETAARERQFLPVLADCLYWRAKARSEARHPGAEADFLAALEFYRQSGIKLEEAKLYHAYAMHLLAVDQPEAALLLLDEALRMNELMGAPCQRPWLMASRAAVLQALGRSGAAEACWLDALALLPQLERFDPGTLLGLLVRRLHFLAAAGRGQEFATALAAARAWAKDAPVSAFQRQGLDALEVVPPALVARADALPPVELQPFYLATRTAAGSVARGGFWLLNPAASPRPGQLLVCGRGEVTLLQSTSCITVVAQPDAGGPATNHLLEVVLPASAGVPVRMQCTGVGEGPAELTLSWQAEGAVTSTWSVVGQAGESESASTIHASLSLANAFFAVPVYHELGAPAAGRSDFRIRASQPCRVEIYDAGSAALLAVDADGDGGFLGRGDVIGVDEDLDGLPDAPAGLAVWVRVYPGAGRAYPEALDLRVETRSSGEWQTVGHDRIIGFGRADAPQG